MLPGLGADDPLMKLGLNAGSAMQGSQKQLMQTCIEFCTPPSTNTLSSAIRGLECDGWSLLVAARILPAIARFTPRKSCTFENRPMCGVL